VRTTYRVVYEAYISGGKREWRERPFGTDVQAAHRFRREQHAKLLGAIVQWWSDIEQKWIG
jgi:hypothetical protein